MDGIITPEQLQALEAQAAQQQVNLNQASIRPSLERDAALVAEYARKSAQQVRQPSSISEFFFKGPVVPIEERLGYAREAARLQGDIQRRIQEAGLMQGPVQQTQAEQVATQSSPEQPQPAAAPSAPEQPATAPEKPQYDPFEQFRRVDEMRRGFFGAAVSKLNELPQQYRAKALRAAKDYWEMTGPKLPPNALLPVQNPLTGDMIQGMAMTPEGKIVELPKTSQETPKELSSVATKRAEEIANADESLSQLDAAISYMSDPKIGRNDKITFGKNFLQRYNIIQSQGPNVLGVDEAKRLGGALESRFLNLSGLINNEQMFGTDLPRFVQQLNDTKMTIQAGRKSSISTLKRISPNTAAYFEGQDSNQQQQSAPGGVVEFMRAPGKGGIIKK